MTIASAPPLATPTSFAKHHTHHSPDSAAASSIPTTHSASPAAERRAKSPTSAASSSSSGTSSGRSSGTNSAQDHRASSRRSSVSISSSPPSSGSAASSGSESSCTSSFYRGASISPPPRCCDSPAPGSPVMASFSFALSGHHPARTSGGGAFVRGLGWELLPVPPSSMPAPSRLIGDRHEPVHEVMDSPGQETQFGSSSSQPVWRQLPSKMILPLQATPRLRTHSSTLQSNLPTTVPTPQRLSSAGSLQHLLPPLTLDHEISTPVLRHRKQLPAAVATASPSLKKERQLPEREREPKPETPAPTPAAITPTSVRGVSSICLRLPVPACLSPAMTRLYGLFNSWRLHTTDAQSWGMLCVASACAALLGFLVFEACIVLVACMLVLRGLQLTVTFHFHKSQHRKTRRSAHASTTTTLSTADVTSSPSESSDTGSESNTPALDTKDLPLPRDSPAPLASSTPTLSDATVLASMHQQASKLMALDALAKPVTSTPIEVRPIQQQRSIQPSGIVFGEEADSCGSHPVLSHASFSSSSPLLADPLLRTVHPFFQGRAQLVGWLDHAIRNPLHAIIASADLMRSNSAEPEEANAEAEAGSTKAPSSSLGETDLECLTAIVDAATNIQEILMSLQQLVSTCVDPDAGLSTGGDNSVTESKHNSAHVSPTPPGANEISPEKETSIQAHEERKQTEVGEGSLVWPNASSSAPAAAVVDPAAPTSRTSPRNLQPSLMLPQSSLVSPAASTLVTREHTPRDAVDAAARAFDDELNMQLMSPHGSMSVPTGLTQPNAEASNGPIGTSNALPPTHNKSHSLSTAAAALGGDFPPSATSGSWSFPASIPVVVSASTPPLPIFNPLTNLRSQPSTPVTTKRRLTMRSELTPPLSSPPAATASELEGVVVAAAASSSSSNASPSLRALDVQRPNSLQHVSSIRELPTSCASASPAQVTPVVVVPQVGVRTPPVSRATVEPEPIAQPSSAPHPQPQSQQLDYRSCRVLVVDDSPINVKILSRMLTGLGLSVYTAADGLQAVEAVQKLAAVTTHATKEKRKQRHTKRQQRLAATQAAAAEAASAAASSASHNAAASAPPITPIMHAQEAMAQRSFSAHSPQQPSFLRVPHSARVSSTSAGGQATGSSDDGSSSQSRNGSGSESVSPASSPAPSPSLAPSHSPATSASGLRKGTWRAKRHFDIILSDVNMPLMNGLESSIKIRELEQMHGLPRVPIIAVTANSSLEDRAACADAGMNYFVQKPFVRNDIIVLVQQILQAQQQQQQALEQVTPLSASSATRVVQQAPPQTLAPLLPPLDTGAAHTHNMIAAAAAAAAAAATGATTAEASTTATDANTQDSLPVVSAPPRPLSGFDSTSPDLSLTRCVSDLTAERWIGSPSHVTMDSASLHSSSSAAAAAPSDAAASNSAPSSSSTSLVSPTPSLPMSPLRHSPAPAAQRYRTLGLKGGSSQLPDV